MSGPHDEQPGQFRDELYTALMALTRTLQRHGVKGGFMVSLMDAEDGDKMSHALAEVMPLLTEAQQTEQAGLAYRELTFVGVKFRWPAMKWAMPGGGHRYG